jgi:hypothetical protein
MQTKLLLSRDERLDALVATKPEDVGVKRRAWRNVFELLRQIEFCGGRSENSFACVETLAARMGVSERTVQRAAAVAIGAGLLVRSARHRHNGQASNEWAIQWDRIALAAGTLPEKAQSKKLSPTPDVVSPTPDELSPTPDKLSPPIENQQIPSRESSRKVDRPNVDHGNAGAGKALVDHHVDWDRAVGLASDVVRKLGREPSRADWNTVVKAAALSHCYGEQWLWDSLSAVESIRPRNLYGYLWSCWEDGAKQQGRRFRRDLAALEVPIPAVLSRTIAIEQLRGKSAHALTLEESHG